MTGIIPLIVIGPVDEIMENFCLDFALKAPQF